jgi:hypothetical protein
MKIKSFTKYLAIFKPKKLETLKPELKQFIGKQFTFLSVFIQDEGVYQDQWCFEVVDQKK